jgi:Helix-turn-helix domain
LTLPKLPKLEKNANITGAERVKLRADLKKHHENGASKAKLAKEIGRSRGFVHNVLTEDDTFRDPNYVNEKRVAEARSEREKLGPRLKKEYENGASLEQLVRATGRSQPYVHRVLKEAGTKFRSPGRPRSSAT